MFGLVKLSFPYLLDWSLSPFFIAQIPIFDRGDTTTATPNISNINDKESRMRSYTHVHYLTDVTLSFLKNIAMPDYPDFISFNDITTLITFEPQQTAFYGICTILGAIASVLYFPILLSSYNQIHSPRFALILSLAISDYLLSLHSLVHAAVNWFYNGFATGQTGCLISSFITVTFCTTSALSLMMITMERYLSIMKGMELDFRKAKIWISSVWAFATIFGLYPFYTNSYKEIIVLHPSRLTCAYFWFSPDPFILPASIITLSMVAIVTGFVNFAYTRIVLFYFGRKKNKQGMTSKEFLLLKKSLIICFCQMFGWSLFFVEVLYEIINRKSISVLFDGISLCFAASNTVGNAIILISLDSNVRSNLNDLVGKYYGLTLKSGLFNSNTDLSGKEKPRSKIESMVGTVNQSNAETQVQTHYTIK
ncbi:hypothetical protein HDV06_006582 [Boothiomyces sp. JEL0866]|nr:hypothetical protein HDV06_006582 [Boothiomyces sp. JEL0866]